jgi:hypothetical protein
VKSDTGDPAGGAEGYIYYNTFDNKFRCYQNSGWTDCIGSGGAFTSAGGTITKTASTDKVQLTMAEAGDYGLRVDTSTAPTVDLVQIVNANGTTTDGTKGMLIDFLTADDAAADTNYGLYVSAVSDIASSDSSDVLYGLYINTYHTAGSATGISIASGATVGINLNANTLINIGDANTDFTSTGGLTLADILTVNDDMDVNLAAGENVTFASSAAPTADMLALTNSGQGTVTNGIDGLAIAFTQADDADATDTNAAAHIVITNSSGDADTLYGLQIDGITGGAATETALSIGAGWDTGIDLNANTLVNIGNSGTDFTSSGGLTLAGTLDSNGDVTIADTNIVLDGATTTFTSTGAITLQAAGSGSISTVSIGAGGSGSTTPDYLALDVKSDTGDPAGGAEGYIYYNTFDNKFRCYQNSGWTDCIGTGGSSPFTSSGGIISQTTSTDKTRITSNEAGDYAILLDASVAPTVDLVQISNAGFGTTTNGVDGLNINFVQTGGGTSTNAAAHITITPSGNSGDVISGLQINASGATNATEYGAYISSITGGSGAETALYIGSGWDTGIDLNANTLVNIGSTDTDFTSTGGLTVGGDTLTVNDDLDINLAGGENATILAIATQTADMLFLSSNGENTVTNGVDAIHAVLTQGNDGDASDSNAGLHLDFNSNSTQADNLYGIWVGNITAGNATEIGLNVGTGWDRGLSIADANTYSVLLASDDGDVASGMTFGSTSPVSIFRSAANKLTIGSTTNGYTFDIASATSASNPLFNGTSQPSKTITLYPEYPGASLTTFYGAGTDSNVSGTVNAVQS